MAESWEFEEGAEIAPGRTVVRNLGGGHRYEVFLVWDDHLFALVVAKVLRPHLATEERYHDELREEAAALARLAHPVIVRGFGAASEGPHPHVLIEHLEGPTLRRLLRRGGAAPLEQLLPLAAHVAAALHYMAAEEMVHLDVKPDNIVMGVPPRLIDLSIARTFESAARARRSLGTDAYMPPSSASRPSTPGRSGRRPTSGGSAPRSITPSRARCPFRASARTATARIPWCASLSSRRSRSRCPSARPRRSAR